MTNTVNLPAANFSVHGDSMAFRVRCNLAEFRAYMSVVFCYLAEDISIDVEFESPSSLGAEFGRLSVRVWNHEFRAREVAEQLNDVLTAINANG